MRGLTAGVIFLHLLTAASGAGDPRDSPVSCASEGVVCQFSADTIIDSVPHVPSLDQCRQLCVDMDSCPYISYSYDNAVLVPNLSQLFTSCEFVNNCSDCYTENIDCRTCGENIIRGLNENVKT